MPVPRLPRPLAALVLGALGCNTTLDPLPPLQGAGGAGHLPPPDTIDTGVNVKSAYGAKGDGMTDDTAALRRALAGGATEPSGSTEAPRTLYLPRGTYLVSDTLAWTGCCVVLVGDGRASTVIKLKEGAAGFGDKEAPKAVLVMSGDEHGKQQALRGLRVLTGARNPGAIAVDVAGRAPLALEDVQLSTSDGRGAAGMMMNRGRPASAVVHGLVVDGFDVGLAIGGDWLLTGDGVTLNDPRRLGIDNHAGVVSIEGLATTGSVPSLLNRAGGVSVIAGATMTGTNASNEHAIRNEGWLYAFDVSAPGYRSAIWSSAGAVPGTERATYASEPFLSPLRHASDPTFTGDPARKPAAPLGATTRIDLGAVAEVGALQAAFDAASPTVQVTPPGKWDLAGWRVRVPPTVTRVVGTGITVAGGGLTLEVGDTTSAPVLIEGFGGVTVVHGGKRTVALRHGRFAYATAAEAGDVFFDDVALFGPVIVVPGQRAWARGLSLSGSGGVLLENRGRFWAVGLKAETTGTALKTGWGGVTEVLGGLVVTPSLAGTAPLFEIDGGQATLFFAAASPVPDGLPAVIVKERQNAEAAEVTREQLFDGRAMMYEAGPP